MGKSCSPSAALISVLIREMFASRGANEADQGDDWTTALREAREEVGLSFQLMQESSSSTSSPEDVTTPLEGLSRLRTLESLNHLCVTPLVGFVNASSEEIASRIQINKAEVELYFWAPLGFFLTTQPIEEYDLEWRGETFVFRKYMFPLNDDDSSSCEGVVSKEILITGLTAHVAREAAVLAMGDGFPPVRKALTNKSSQEHSGIL
jgi:8-oxo-dGTP pyrophosphatase MutT (NUDIX family)